MSRRRTAALLPVLLLLVAALACRTPDAVAPRAELPRLARHAPPERTFDVLAYTIELELQPERLSLEGVCTVRFAALEQPLESLRLDLVGLAVEGVTDEGGSELAFERTAGVLAIELDEPLASGAEGAVRVRYGGRPERGLWFAGERLDGSGPTLVFSHGQTQDSRGWFPCFDHPSERAVSELVLTVPRAWVVSASGERSDVREEGDRRTERWRMQFPHPSYLLGFVAGELVSREGRAGDVPLAFLAEPRFQEWIEPTFEETDEILAFLEDYTGIPYPYARYSQAAVDNFPWGGMENIAATTLTPLLLTDERGRRDQPSSHLIAHEAAHQWFGNLFTCADWSHLWLNEGFATYLTLLYVEHTQGLDEFRAQLREVQEAYLAADTGPGRRPTVWSVWKEPDDVFDTRAYQGAAARLHLLRFVVGDEAFQAGVRAYAREQRGRGVVTDDLRRALEAASGRDLGRIFEQWLTSPGFPEFAVAWEWDEASRCVRLEVAQVQASEDGTPAVFELPIEVEVRAASGARVHRLRLARRRERFQLPAPERPLYVHFDPHGWVPKRVRELRELPEWLALAQFSADVNARREAVLALGRLAGAARERNQDGASARKELAARLRADPSAWVRADAATALGTAGGKEAEDALRRAGQEDVEPRVQAAALLALRTFGPDPGLASLAEAVFHGGSSYRVMASAAALLCQAAPERAFEFLGQALEVASPHDALAALLLVHLAELPDPRVPAELRRHAADPWLAPTARAVAVQGLARTQRERLENSRFLLAFLAEESFHLRGAAVQALAGFGDEGAYRALREYYPRARTSAERRTIEVLLERRAP